LLMRYF